ncbi:MAG: DUF503 domain-containing protein [Nitrospinota bacterium]|jgi:hypothetical protein|nr:DUF503 domain-containing protein [Nitrospinota bacterium]|tara:strand:- start:191 stop:472 length:282 start_codon:yes stop_codon:yes gene_type:complete
MVIGVCTIELRIHGGRSLKEKRRVLRSVKDRIRNRFNVSIAEVDYQDKWQRALLALAAVSNERNHVTGLLESALSAVESMGLAEIVDAEIEIL